MSPARRDASVPERSSEIALAASMSATVSLLSLAFARDLPPAVPLWLLLAAALYPAWLRRFARGTPSARGLVRTIALLVALVLSLVGRGGLPLAFASVGLFAWVGRRRIVDAVFVVVACALSPLVGAMSWPPALAALPLAIPIAVVAAVALHARVASASAKRAASSGRRAEGLAYGLGLGLSLLLVALSVLGGQMQVLERLDRLRAASGAGDRRGAARLAGSMFPSAAAQRNLRFSFGDDLTSEGRDPDGEDARLFLVSLHDLATGEILRDGRPFLLRASVVDRAEATGFFAAPRRGRTWSVDRNGRVELEPGAKADLEVRIHGQEPLRFGAHSSVLVGPEPRLALRLPPELADGGRIAEPVAGVLALDSAASTMDYAVSTDRRRFERAYLTGPRGLDALSMRRALLRDPRYVSLPDRIPDGLVALARRATAGADTDLEKVLCVVRDLGQRFRYDRTAAFLGSWEDVESLLFTGRGVCSHFAAAAMAMLRSLGVPCRIATGFLVKDYDDDTHAYGVWESNAHAWIEVPFEGEGFVPFDVTPRAALAGMLSGTLPIVEPGAEASPRALGSRPGMEDAIRGALSLCAAALRSIPWSPLAVVAALSLLAAANLLSRRRSRRGGIRGPAATGTGQPLSELIALLRRAGFSKRPGQTPLELARQVRSAAGGEFDDLPVLVEALYRSRFGGRPLAPPERELLERVLDRLRSRGGGAVRPPPAGGGAGAGQDPSSQSTSGIAIEASVVPSAIDDATSRGSVP